MKKPLVHVLVINWNGLEHLQACFSSLLAGTYENAAFVLVDNASEDDSIAYVQKHFGHDPRVQLCACERNLGWSGGNNRAMQAAMAAKADYVFLLNNDTAVAPDAIEKMVALAESDPTIGVVAPKMVLFDTPEILNSVGLTCSWVGGSWDIGVGRVDTPQWDRHEPVIGACGGACLIRTEALDKTGLLPEEFEIYLDDLDLCLRIWDAGYRILPCPEAVIRHKFSATWGQGAWARRKYYLNTRNRFRLILRNFPLRTFPVVWPTVAVGEIRATGRAILDHEWWRVAQHIRAWGATLTYLPQAIRARRKGAGRGIFWPMIRRDRMFCPGVILPQKGWYEAREYNGQRVHPFAKHAVLEVEAGTYTLTHLHPYPHLGETRIRVMQSGNEIALLHTTTPASIELELKAGQLEFTAETLFMAEDTGELCDLGGWIALNNP